MGIKRRQYSREQKEERVKNKIKDIAYRYPYYGYRRVAIQLRRKSNSNQKI